MVISLLDNEDLTPMLLRISVIFFHFILRLLSNRHFFIKVRIACTDLRAFHQQP